MSDTATQTRTALATYSLRMATSKTGQARRRALAQHFAAFPPVIGSACRRGSGSPVGTTPS
jgi:hypothetical protein